MEHGDVKLKYGSGGIWNIPLQAEILMKVILKTEDIFEKMILPATMMIEADSSQGLIQAIGYLKYNLSQEHYDV